jgi:hypothetical protein
MPTSMKQLNVSLRRTLRSSFMGRSRAGGTAMRVRLSAKPCDALSRKMK